MLDIEPYRETLNLLCRKSMISKLYFFGSALTPRFKEASSDIDILVEISDHAGLQPEAKGEYLLNLWNDLETLFRRKVDLLTESSLRNPYLRQEIERTKILIYDGQG